MNASLNLREAAEWEFTVVNGFWILDFGFWIFFLVEPVLTYCFPELKQLALRLRACTKTYNLKLKFLGQWIWTKFSNWFFVRQTTTVEEQVSLTFIS
jgi:hypothetical protein